MEESDGCQVDSLKTTRLTSSVMIQKLDKKGLAMRLFGRANDEQGVHGDPDVEANSPVDTEE